MTADLRWLFLAVLGGITLWLGLRAVARRLAPATHPPELIGDPTRVTILCALPFAIRLLQLGGDARPYVYPALTLPVAPWSVWIASLMLLGLPLLLWRRKGSGLSPPLAMFALGLLVVLVMGIGDSPFDERRFEKAVREHEAYCHRLQDQVPQQLTDLRVEVDRELTGELESARQAATAVFRSRGTDAAVALIEARRPELEQRGEEWSRRVQERERYLEAERGRESREADATTYPGSFSWGRNRPTEWVPEEKPAEPAGNREEERLRALRRAREKSG